MLQRGVMGGRVPQFGALGDPIGCTVFGGFTQQKLLEFLLDLIAGHCTCQTLSALLSVAEDQDLLFTAMSLQFSFLTLEL